MKRSDFFKMSGALIVAPLAVKGALKDNACHKKPFNAYGKLECYQGTTPPRITVTDYGFEVGDVIECFNEQYVGVRKTEQGLVCLRSNLFT